jgi:hypothetical protein
MTNESKGTATMPIAGTPPLESPTKRAAMALSQLMSEKVMRCSNVPVPKSSLVF